MKELKEFTVERLEYLFDTCDLWPPTIDECKSLAKIALAAKQAKPIGYLEHSHYEYLQAGVNAEIWPNGDAGDIPVYTTPPLNHIGSTNEMVVPDGWIKCSDRMPDASGEFSVYETLNNRVQHDYWVPDDCAALGLGFWNHYGTNVTHWMPLPKPPVDATKPEV